MGYDDWDELVDELASDLAPALRRHIYVPYLDRLRELGTNAEKLVYLYLVLAQPQSFTTLRKGLNVNKMTLSRALRKLKDGGYILRDSSFLYWIKD